MKKVLALFAVLLVLPTAVVNAADSEVRRSRRQRAVPGPEADMESICNRILDEDSLASPGGYGGYSDDNDRGESGPDDVYDGI